MKAVLQGLPGGWRNDSGDWEPPGYYGDCWSTTEYDAVSVWGNELYNKTTISRICTIGKKGGCSVRCLKD
jgi:hypothetical protein